MAISVSQGGAKSQFLKILKSRNLAQFLKFLPNFWHVSSIFKQVQLIYSNIRPKTNPSLISRGGYQIPPGLEKIKIVQYPRDFPDELSKFTRLFITLSHHLRMYLVFAPHHLTAYKLPFSHGSLSFRQFRFICLIDFIVQTIHSALSNRLLLL